MEENKNNNTDKVSESSPIVGYIRQRFQQSETSKIYDEKRFYL